MLAVDASLRITEIFYSLQGETTTVGLPTVFVRLTGCPLRCVYCDTTYAFTGGRDYSIDEIIDEVGQYHPRYVTVTGGEPLAQKSCRQLLIALCDKGYEVSLETSGAMDISAIDSRVVRVLDVKTPGSKEVERNKLDNLALLTSRDQLKFVICDRDDYTWSCEFVEQHGLAGVCEILFSPSYQQQDAGELADWILSDKLQVRLQIQLHKILWGDEPGR